MENKWSEEGAAKFIKEYHKQWGEDLALRTYSSRLLGSEKELVLHGGGNCSVKGIFPDILGRTVPVLYVKASGFDLDGIKPDGFSPLKLEYLAKLESLKELSDEELLNQMKIHLFQTDASVPSFETLVHAFIPEKYIDHTHSRAILTLSNRKDGKKILRKLFRGKLGVIDYAKPGLPLAQAVSEAVKQSPGLSGLVLMHHGLITWGKTSRESYDRTIEMVNLAESYIGSNVKQRSKFVNGNKLEAARKNYLRIAPILRGSLAKQRKDEDWPYDRFILKTLISEEVLGFMEQPAAKTLALSAPVTLDHLIRTKPFPLWLGDLDPGDDRKARKQINSAVSAYKKDYQDYFKRNSGSLSHKAPPHDGMPRIIFIPGIGVVCAGKDAAEAEKVRDFTRETLAIKNTIALMGEYNGLSEKHLFEMEYSSIQLAKLKLVKENRLQRSVAVVTGGAGAIGWGICQGLLEAGCQVAVTDLPGNDLDTCFTKLNKKFPKRVMAVPMDVTDPESVRQGFERVIAHWGGIDVVIPNAGVAHVSSLAEMDPRNFKKLSQVNIDGTLYVISEAARHFKFQATGGDIVLISTKNVFSPGAKFGAYSATKAAAHQLARIASLELAEIGVRVNMVSPDAVFSHEQRKSGLWAEVGPDRMKARGLDEKGLAAYYQSRNMLKSKVTARHVANAVLFFVTHQTPTTGATIPVDGGLPDATPR